MHPTLKFLNFVSFLKNALLGCVVLGFCFLILSGGTAQAEGNHFLSFGLAGGGSIAPSSELESSPAVGDADFDGGYSIKAALGFLLAKQLQLEGEYLFTHNRIGSLVNPLTVTNLVDSDRETHNLMLSATYRIEVPPLGDTYWTRRGYYIYFGGGAGISWQDYTLETLASQTGSSLAWQVLVGLRR